VTTPAAERYAIRLALPDEVPHLPELERRAVRVFEGWERATGLTLPVLFNVTEVDELDAALKAGHLWVAAGPDGELVGFAQMLILDGCAHLDEIDVVPEHAGRGLGSRMLNVLCDWARAQGFSRMTLSTFRDVPWNLPFYQRRGFRVLPPDQLPPEHRDLVAAEQMRGLRTDLRSVMALDLDS
jgi:GNAT superfamily N-acetyltransferase